MTNRAVVVGITLRPQEIEGYPRRLAQNCAYVDALVAAGAVPLAIAPLRDKELLRLLWERCDALLLPGGPDVHPNRYGESPIPGFAVRTAPALDAAEFSLLRWALDERRPVLAICRGLQLLNVALGGTLWQDVALQGAGMGGHDSPDGVAGSHAVEVVPGTLLHSVLARERMQWNSLHHQGVHDLAPGLAVSARSEDGLIEGIELPGQPVLAVQCHPESLTQSTDWAAGVFDWLVDAARPRVAPGVPG